MEGARKGRDHSALTTRPYWVLPETNSAPYSPKPLMDLDCPQASTRTMELHSPHVPLFASHRITSHRHDWTNAADKGHLSYLPTYMYRIAQLSTTRVRCLPVIPILFFLYNVVDKRKSLFTQCFLKVAFKHHQTFAGERHILSSVDNRQPARHAP
ncbi:hypothetical protein DER44DRAFT_740482 [Fusarium oxysporum]|nr:hypothetical protein DER44DRAFT_740482 [Fusarium oxysporum]